MHYHFKGHKEKDYYWAECIELDGCSSQGKNKKELIDNLHEALNLYLDESASSNVIFPLPQDNITGENIIQIKVEPSIAFSTYLRQQRLKNHMTQKEIANKLGFNNIWSYQRFEKHRNANPNLKILAKLSEIFPDFDFNLIIN